jgi:hypothetical protein
MEDTKLTFARVEIHLQESSDITGSIHLIGEIEPIGSFEGRLIKGGLYTVIHLDHSHQKKGIGFEILQGVLAYWKDKGLTARFIAGSWHRDQEFASLPDGQSTNLSVFKAQLAYGEPLEKAALLTPTGKWAQRLGYSEAIIILHTENDVLVHFHPA